MIKKQYSLTILLFLLSINTLSIIKAQVDASIVYDWWYTPGNNDSRLLPVTILGTLTAALGLYSIKKGLDKTFLNNEQNNDCKHKISRAISRTFSKIGGICATGCGLGLLVAGIAAILCNKEIIKCTDQIIADAKWNH